MQELEPQQEVDVASEAVLALPANPFPFDGLAQQLALEFCVVSPFAPPLALAGLSPLIIT